MLPGYGQYIVGMWLVKWSVCGYIGMCMIVNVARINGQHIIVGMWLVKWSLIWLVCVLFAVFYRKENYLVC